MSCNVPLTQILRAAAKDEFWRYIQQKLEEREMKVKNGDEWQEVAYNGTWAFLRDDDVSVSLCTS